MYADRNAKPSLKPGSLGVALAINGAVIAALIYSSPEVIKTIDHPFEATNIPLPPPPKPLPTPKIEARVAHQNPAPQKPTVIDQPIVKADPTGPVFESHPGFDPGPGGIGTGVTVDPPKPAPVIVGPRLDGKFAANFQPTYPAEERRAGNSGRVVVRVLISADGRVKQVERVAAPSDAFFEATMRRAIDKWRFKPATRDGVPVEAWFTVGVSFVLSD